MTIGRTAAAGLFQAACCCATVLVANFIVSKIEDVYKRQDIVDLNCNNAFLQIRVAYVRVGMMDNIDRLDGMCHRCV